MDELNEVYREYEDSQLDASWEARTEEPEVDLGGFVDMVNGPDASREPQLCTFCGQNPCACEEIESEIDAARERDDAQQEFDSQLDASFEARTDLGD